MADPTSSEQLEAAKQLTEAIKNFASLTEKNNSLLRSQLEITRQISGYSKTVSDSTTTTTQSLNDAAESVDRLNNSSLEDLVSQLDDVNDKAEESSGIFSKISGLIGKVIKSAAAIGSFALEKFFSVLKGIYSIGKTVVSTLFSIVGVIWDLGKALLSIPFKAFDWLVAKAQSMGGGGNEYAQAIQDIKKEYGDLSQIAPQTIMSMARNTKSLTEVGIKARRVYGNLGERMKLMLEFSQKLGPLFESFASELEETGLKIPTLAKGMGLADEQALTLAQRAKTMGIKMQDQFLNIHKMSWTLGKNYGHATKLLNRDVALAMKDVKRFGGATEAQMMSAAVYARSLGLELDKISGILDAFDTFEGAADVASKLAQTWGVQIDPFALLNEQDPVAIIEAIRQGFAKSGKDITQFNRAEKDLLAQLTKLSPEITQQALSLHNQGVALEDIVGDANTASKSFTTLDGALEQLRGSIEKIVQSGSMPQFEGFFDAWWKGIQRGIELNPEFRGLFRDIRQGLRFTFYDAQRVLDAFVEHFPGVKDMIQGLREIFNPAKIGSLFGGINNEIILFLRNLKDGKATFSSLMTGITKQFEDYLGGAEKGGSKFLNGLGAFGETVAKIAGSIIEWIGEAIADGIIWLTSFINEPSKYLTPLADGVSTVAGSVASGASSVWAPLWAGIEGAWDHILSALSGLALEIGEQLPLFKEFLELFQDSDQYMPDGSGKMSKLRVKILTFWEEMKVEFNNITNMPFFQEIKDVFSNLNVTLKDVVQAVFTLAGAMALSSFVPGKFKALAAGIGGFGSYFGSGELLEGKSDEEIKSMGVEAIKYVKDAYNVSKDTTAEATKKLKKLAEEGADKSLEFAVQLGADIQSLSKDITEKMSASNISDAASHLYGLAQEKLKGFNTLIDSPNVNIGQLQQLLQDAKGFADAASSKAAEAAATAAKVVTEVGDTVASVVPHAPSTTPPVPPPPKPPSSKGMIPSFNALNSLTFEDVSKSISYLGEAIGEGGKSVIRRLVASLKDSNSIISNNGAEEAAKNVATFFDHVSSIAVSLGKLQELVSVADAEGKNNLDVVKTNINKFGIALKGIIGTAAAGDGITGVISSIKTLFKTLNDSGITDQMSERIRLFFDSLAAVATSFSIINEKRIAVNEGEIDSALLFLSTGIGLLNSHLPTIQSEISTLSTTLTQKDGNTGTIPTKVQTFLKTFKPLVDNIKLIRASLKEIAGIGSDPIDVNQISGGIGNVASAISTLKTSMSEEGEGKFKNVLSGVTEDNTSTRTKGDFKISDKAGLAGVPAQLSALKDGLSEISKHIGDVNSPSTIMGSLSTLSTFASALKPGGDIGSKLGEAKAAVITQFFNELQSGVPKDSKTIVENFTAFRKALGTQGFEAEISKISASVEKFKSLGDSVQGIPDLKTFDEAVSAIAKFSGFGGPYSIENTQVVFDITVNVRLQTSELEFAVLSDKDSIVVDRLNFAMTSPTTTGPAINPAAPTAVKAH